MSITCETESRAVETIEQRLERVIALHLHPRDGSAFWIERAASMNVSASDIQTVEDLARLGEMSPEDLRLRPLIDYIPRRFHDELDRFVIGQTGGTTGRGTWTAYREDEFYEAFVDPFVAAARHVGFPSRENWLFVGPTGPHIIGKVVPHLARAMQSPDPFSVDFDPRWARKLPDDSFARQRYLQHVIDQAMDVLVSQDVGVIFTTPVVLDALARQMSDVQRQRIAGVHYGGMRLPRPQLGRFQLETFPNAIHLSGYGNTLMGCCLETSVEPDRNLDYYPHGRRLLLEVIDNTGRAQRPGITGQVQFTRLDESILIVRLRERDEAEAVPRRESAPPGFVLPGVRDPRPPQANQTPLVAGLY